jgi:DNA-binding beta-propeller fold protein YncE
MFARCSPRGSLAQQAQFNSPWSIAIDPTGSWALVADNSNHRIRRIVLSTLIVSTLAGAGQSGSADKIIGSLATFSSPCGVAISPDSRYALVADKNNNRIRSVDLTVGSPCTVAGFYCGGGAVSATQVCAHTSLRCVFHDAIASQSPITQEPLLC